MTEKEKCPVMVGTTKQSNHYQQQHKDNQYLDSSKYSSQLETVTSYLRVSPASRFMCAVDCNIPIQNCCYYVGKLFKSDDIAVIRKDRCRITGEIVQFLSTDRSLFPKNPIQLDLFETTSHETVQVPIDYELLLRIEGNPSEQHLVQEIVHFAGSLRILPQGHKKACEHGWNDLFRGSLTQCDAFVSNLLNVKP